MYYAISIPYTNALFYREAQRSSSLAQINDSAGLKELARREIAYAEQGLLAALTAKLKLSIKIEIKACAHGFEVIASSDLIH